MVLRNTGRFVADKASAAAASALDDGKTDFRLRESREADAIDTKYGFDRVAERREDVGYLVNMHSTEILDEDKRLIAAVD
jgi:DNA polymerase epsilon subunit 1